MNHLRPLRVVPPLQVTQDESCFRAFQSELDYIYRTLRRLGIPSGELEDLAQDIFVALRTSWANYDHSRPLKPYLFGIAFYVVAGHRRKRKREMTLHSLSGPDDGGADPDELLQAKQARAVVLAALESVPLPRRAVLIMHEFDEIPVAQVAQALSIPLFTVYSRLRTGRKELNKALRRILKEVGER